MPTVTMDDRVAKAVGVMAVSRLPGLIVVDALSRPKWVLPGSQVLRLAVPEAYQEDPALVRTIDEAHADRFWAGLGDRTVGDCVPRSPSRPVTVPSDATIVEDVVAQAPDAQTGESLWWAFALGADFGGNGTAVAASANVVAIGIAARTGHRISFWQFSRYGIVVTILSTLIAWRYVWLRYFM